MISLKTTAIVILSALLIYVFAIVWALNAYRFKIIDPADPRFDIESFRIDDYMWGSGMTYAEGQSAFKAGMDRADVERILVKNNGSALADITDELRYHYVIPDATYCIRYDYTPWWNVPVSIVFLHLSGHQAFAILCFNNNNKIIKFNLEEK